jgi:hypothetical protein
MDFGKHKRKYGFYKWIRNITSFFFFFFFFFGKILIVSIFQKGIFCHNISFVLKK